MMRKKFFSVLILVCGLVFAFGACNRGTIAPLSKVSLANYNQITTGMSKSQVETIMGPPTSMETKDMVIFKKTVYRYEDGAKFAQVTFKNDEVDSKDTNLNAP